MPILALAVLAVLAILAGGLALGASGTGGDGSAPSPSANSPIGGDMVYSLIEIARFAKNAGFSGNDLSTAVAIALAESGGNSLAYNPETAANTPPGLGSYGLWQIYKKAHPEYLNVDLFDPQTNANAAYSIYQSRNYNFAAWSTFKNNAYVARLGDAQNAAMNA